MLSKSTEETIISTLQVAFSHQVQGILMYGSRATGHAHAQSDYDIGVLLQTPSDTASLWETAQNLACQLRQDVDLIDLRTSTTVLQKEAITNGVWLLQTDSFACSFFETQVLSMYQELQENRQPIINDLLNRLHHHGDAIPNKHSMIQHCLARIFEEYRGHEDELSTNFTRQDSIILNIQRACQAALDLANRVIRLKQLGIPQNSRESFSLLADHGFVSEPLADSMMKMIGFRNIAVHEYQKLNPDILKAIIEKHIQEIKTFAMATMKSLGSAG